MRGCEDNLLSRYGSNFRVCITFVRWDTMKVSAEQIIIIIIVIIKGQLDSCAINKMPAKLSSEVNIDSTKILKNNQST